MATKKELEARIEALEAEVALLRARPVIAPSYPSYPYGYPNDWYPLYPKVWCGSTASNKTTAAANPSEHYTLAAYLTI